MTDDIYGMTREQALAFVDSLAPTTFVEGVGDVPMWAASRR